MIALPEWLKEETPSAFQSLQQKLKEDPSLITFPMPDNTPLPTTNAFCNSLVGPCCCGKNHTLEDWDKAVLTHVIKLLLGYANHE